MHASLQSLRFMLRYVAECLCPLCAHRNYTISVTFTPPRFLDAPVASPRSNVFAHYVAPHADLIGPYPVRLCYRLRLACPSGTHARRDIALTVALCLCPVARAGSTGSILLRLHLHLLPYPP